MPSKTLNTRVITGAVWLSVLGQTDAFVDFTSASSDGANDHDIRDWRFSPSSPRSTRPRPPPYRRWVASAV